MSIAVGKVVYTHFLNRNGGVEADLTVTRLAIDEFLIITPAFTTTHVHSWIREHTEENSISVVTNISSAWAMLNIQGPNSRLLLQEACEGDFGNTSFPFSTAKKIEVGYQEALALRVSYTGELGWELYIPTEMALSVYDRIVQIGHKYELAHCGYHTLNTLRIEKAYREWAHDMGPLDNLLEAGLGFTCNWTKPGGFIGRNALLEQKEVKSLKRRLCLFLLEDPEPMLHHNEPILRNNERVGYTTSAAYAHSIGASAALGYVSNSDGEVDESFLASASYTIEQADRRYSSQLCLRPPYDPENRRSRS